VVPPLVGPWQLGRAQISGYGTLGHGFYGRYSVNNNPLYEQYQPTAMQAQVTGYSYSAAPHKTSQTLRMTISVTVANAPNCSVGDTATLTLYESAKKLSNHQSSDYITVTNWNGRCPEFFQGWSNQNGGARTSPSYGGPPHGGQWAIVKIAAG
jgi:hypothetical protein